MDNVALVTGASFGIGEAICQAKTRKASVKLHKFALFGCVKECEFMQFDTRLDSHWSGQIEP